VYEVLTAGSVAGEFSTVEGPPGSTFSVAYGPTTVTATVLTVANEPPPGAAGLVLHPPAPNPATGPVTLRYELPAAGRVRLALYDALGREVAVLVDGERPVGRHQVLLDTRTLTAGPYAVHLLTPGRTATRRLSVLR
jgi:hypothetical protein